MRQSVLEASSVTSKFSLPPRCVISAPHLIQRASASSPLLLSASSTKRHNFITQTHSQTYKTATSTSLLETSIVSIYSIFPSFFVLYPKQQTKTTKMTMDVTPPSNPTSPTPEAELNQPARPQPTALPPYFNVLVAADRIAHPDETPYFYLLRRYNLTRLADAPPACPLYQISLYRLGPSDFTAEEQSPKPKYVGTVHYFHDEVRDEWFECLGDYDLVDEEEWDERDRHDEETGARRVHVMGEEVEMESERPKREDETVWVDFEGFARRFAAEEGQGQVEGSRVEKGGGCLTEDDCGLLR
ncbi:hypothetical protein BJ508DRAFT_22341 [Ascobolus immersus RN42]|uniref:Uncharacterized protein n=1 Tax=Ascobolus immersus RN42 TaxID=1160509 RepID=A0A3N4HTK9_ASCIM|nr:hypothetical protein BJ508DRAFT_22341 [Ascobolus immersus RN42]